MPRYATTEDLIHCPRCEADFTAREVVIVDLNRGENKAGFCPCCGRGVNWTYWVDQRQDDLAALRNNEVNVPELSN